MNNSIYDTLKERGFIAQTTDDEAVRKLLDGGQPMCFYIGYDPTAESFHVGHLIPIIVMAHLQKAGHRPIALVGAGTTMVGDPSGRTDMRKMLSFEQISENAGRFKVQLSKFLDFGGGRAIMENNANWLLSLKYVDLLREIGAHFSVNRMLTADCYKSRLERGLSFLEFNYMIMQSYDFLELYRRYGCVLQIGGDDQWSNILAGADLVRRKEAKEVHGLTLSLLTTTDGVKMGKTQKGALWIDAEKTPPFEFYQYFRNVQDGDVVNYLLRLTFLPVGQIKEYGRLEGAALNEAKKVLAYELTKYVHGEEEADKCAELAGGLFGGGSSGGGGGAGGGGSGGHGVGNLASTSITPAQAEAGVGIVELLMMGGLAPSRSEARRLVEQGGIAAAGKRVASVDQQFTAADFDGGEMIIQKGKKTYHKITIKH